MLLTFQTREEIARLGLVWDRLAEAKQLYTPSFADVLDALSDPALAVRIVGWSENGEILALAMFTIAQTVRRFWLGEKPVLSMPVSAARLFGSTSLGDATPAAAKAMMAHVAADRTIDLLVFSDVPQSDPFYALVSGGGWRGPASVSHHRSTRRLAVLPPSEAEYWAALRPSTRKAAQRDLKMFTKLGPVFETFTSPAEADVFLARAAALSARTYQQRLGVATEDSPALRRHFARMAVDGRFCGYIASIDGNDVASAWGDISHGVFYFRKTGFDPAFARYSPGKAILFAAIKDLIESRSAHTFDFSGRDMDYKERFSTAAIPCANFVAARWSRPRGVAAVGLSRLFEVPKQLAPRLLGKERSQKLQRALRK